jgi:hypothetical protein
MKRAKAVIFVVGLALVAVSGYLPWHYVAQYETLRVDFSPMFASEFCTPLGLLLKSISIATWVGGVAVLRYLIY